MAGMDRPVSTPDDREFAHWHRLASKNLIQAATQDTRIPERLDVAEDYGRRALLVGVNSRERMLAMGLITTVQAIRVLHETGLTTERSI